MPSIDAASSSALYASNPVMLMMSRASRFLAASRRTSFCSVSSWELTCLTLATYCSISTMSPGRSFRLPRYDWCRSPDVSLPVVTGWSYFLHRLCSRFRYRVRSCFSRVIWRSRSMILMVSSSYTWHIASSRSFMRSLLASLAASFGSVLAPDLRSPSRSGFATTMGMPRPANVSYVLIHILAVDSQMARQLPYMVLVPSMNLAASARVFGYLPLSKIAPSAFMMVNAQVRLLTSIPTYVV